MTSPERADGPAGAGCSPSLAQLTGGEVVAALQEAARETNRRAAWLLRLTHEAARALGADTTARADEAGRFGADEVRAALVLSHAGARRRVDLAEDLVERLPEVLEVLEAGLIDEPLEGTQPVRIRVTPTANAASPPWQPWTGPKSFTVSFRPPLTRVAQCPVAGRPALARGAGRPPAARSGVWVPSGAGRSNCPRRRGVWTLGSARTSGVRSSGALSSGVRSLFGATCWLVMCLVRRPVGGERGPGGTPLGTTPQIFR